jgi:DegV family protein with EDD domain
MKEYIIVAESTSDIPEYLVKELGVVILPMTFLVDGEEYADTPDHKSMPLREFYEKQKNGAKGGTSAVNPTAIAEILRPHLKQGKDVLYLAFSSGLSMTYDNALKAQTAMGKEFPDNKFIVINTFAASLGQGMLVHLAVKNQRAGMNLQDNADYIEKTKNNLCHFFTVKDLFHLKRGGRVSGAVAILGTALSIKPVLHVDNEGKLVPLCKVRGRTQSLDKLVDLAAERAINPQEQVMFISHADAQKEAEYVKAELKKKLKPKDVIIGEVGPVIGNHAGSGTLALFLIGTEK